MSPAGRPSPRLLAAALACAIGSGAAAAEPPSPRVADAVTLEIDSASDGSLEAADDLAALLEGAGKRLLPVVGQGPLRTLDDLRTLREVDAAILQADVLEARRESGPGPDADDAVTLIAKLGTKDLYVVARAGVRSVADLAGQTVNVGPHGGGAALMAGRVFDALGVPVVAANDGDAVAAGKLSRGAIAALVVVAARPASECRAFRQGDGFHLLPIPLGGAIPPYMPSLLTAADCPGLVPAGEAVDTVAVGTLLAAAATSPGDERQRRVAGLVDALFGRFGELLGPGHLAAWQGVNLSAGQLGWRRSPLASQWLAEHSGAMAGVDQQAVRAAFSRFLDRRERLAGRPPLTQAEKEPLFDRFERWRLDQTR